MYRAYLQQSQVFVGIYWQQYGRIAPGMEISGLEDEYRLAADKPMLLYLKRPAPNQQPGLTAMINSIRSAGAASYRHFTTARELERLLVDDLAVLLSESFADATISTGGGVHHGRARRARRGGAAGRNGDLPFHRPTPTATDPIGRLLSTCSPWWPEFESDLIRLRTREGMKVVKAKGRLG
jgi:hypothetical protein